MLNYCQSIFKDLIVMFNSNSTPSYSILYYNNYNLVYKLTNFFFCECYLFIFFIGL